MQAGTRALLEFLRLNPAIFAPGPEVHFFDKHFENGFDWYRYVAFDPSLGDSPPFPLVIAYETRKLAPLSGVRSEGVGVREPCCCWLSRASTDRRMREDRLGSPQWITSRVYCPL